MDNEIINRVAQSGIITIDLETYFPSEPIIAFDLKPLLFMEIMLKEKEFRKQLKEMDWHLYENKQVAVFCSSEAIIPRWAYMLVISYLQEVTPYYFVGNIHAYEEYLTLKALRETIDIDSMTDKRIIIKGCGDKNLSERVYAEITSMLLPVVKSLMYGEACSSVPVFKKR